jgi:hypothetical protein
MRSFLPTVVTAAFIALAYAAPVHTGEIEVLQYGMVVSSRRVNASFNPTDNAMQIYRHSTLPSRCLVLAARPRKLTWYVLPPRRVRFRQVS